MDLVAYWKQESPFQQINQFVSELAVINDAAERSVKFGGDYDEIFLNKSTTIKHTLGCVKNTTNFCYIKTNLSKNYLIFFVFNKFKNFWNLLKFDNSVFF